jgi:hypothetical protein
VVSEAAALLPLGLVQPWGEVVPRWIPFIGGRPVRPMAAVVPSMTGAAILTVLWASTFWNIPRHDFFSYFDDPFQKVLVTACYVPLLAWGPLLAIVAIAYHRRRGVTICCLERVRPCRRPGLPADRG